MKLLSVGLVLVTVTLSLGQMISIEGKVSDEKNKRMLDKVQVAVYSMDSNGPISKAFTNQFGSYILQVPENGTYAIRVVRQAYFDKEQFVTIEQEDQIIDIQMSRLPGYVFEANVLELLSFQSNSLGKELKNLKIEVFNNTNEREIIVIEDDPTNTFEVVFERNNKYTILLRKSGYFAKRIEVFVDIEGCILCFEGLGNNFAPEIEAATTDENQRGTLTADIPMKKIIQDEAITLDNIYYDYDKWNIRQDARPALENLVRILRRNPIIIELSSHTDSRGKDDYNQTLSQKRADSAVDYIVSRGIKASRITARGYGESVLINQCENDVNCTDAEHQKNRRTEFKVVDFIQESSFDNKSLKEIILAEKAAGRRSSESLRIFEK